MKVLTAADIRLWDQYTIAHEPISSLDLMERAATACTVWLRQQYPGLQACHIFCGKGNNGGDGLAIARLLAAQGAASAITVSILEFGHKGSEDFQANLSRLHQYPQVHIQYIQSAAHFHPVAKNELIIDALFGSGINRPLDGLGKALVQFINEQPAAVVSVDLPSGLFADHTSGANEVICATHTLSFQCNKLAFLMPENAGFTGEVHLLDIGLHPGFSALAASRYEQADHAKACSVFRPRQPFAHKGQLGHALLIAGSTGKTGAALLSSRACLRTGVGLLTVHAPASAYTILQSGAPEAMVVMDKDADTVTQLPGEPGKYAAIGAGPGLGTAAATQSLLTELLQQYRQPLVLDADALNILAAAPGLLSKLPAYSILTPHPKEFERLFGISPDDFSRAELALERAKAHQCIIVLKGHYTLIATPEGKGYFNSTGNAGMATGGSGDVLTGMLTSLLAQGYPPEDAALLGVYLHGKAGDFAAAKLSKEAMLASDIIDNIGAAFFQMYK